MDDIFSYSRGARECCELYKRSCTRGKPAGRGKPRAKFLAYNSISFLLIMSSNLYLKVVLSWLGNNNQPFGSPTGTGAKNFGPASLKDALKAYSSKSFSAEIEHWKEAYSLKTNVGKNPVDGLHLWHGAIRKDLNGILEELYQIRSSDCFSTLAPVIVQIKFLTDVLFFYR